MANDKRENALCGAGLVLSAQMSGGVTTIDDHLFYFVDKIRGWNLSPWGRKGREYLIGGVNELRAVGDYESLTICESCRKRFLMKLDTTVVDFFLKGIKGEIDLSDWMKCNECGGSVELEN